MKAKQKTKQIFDWTLFWWSSDFDLRHRNFLGANFFFSSSSLGTWESGYAAALIKKEGEEFMRGLTISDRPPLS
jgi:hypothetical protein